MWRAFFYALGITLVLLGTQCLFVEQFQVADSTRMPGFVSRLLDSQKSQSQSGGNALVLPAGQTAQGGYSMGNSPQIQQSRMPAANTGSAYGPSRFDSQYGSSNFRQGGYYGGRPSTDQQPFSLAGFGNTGGQPVQQFPTPVLGNSKSPTNVFGEAINTKVLKTKEWMPWSLLAAGTLVVLYTKGTKANFNRE